MAKFIAVIHRWHVESLGFSVHELNCPDSNAAEREAAFLAMKAQGVCRAADYMVVAMADREVLLPRRP